jgi:DNA polymerase I-like protein with 3'-5' exonuclease and polymerase domains
MAMQRAADFARTPHTATPERFLLNPGIEETLTVLDRIKTEPEIAIDVETGYGQINTVGFAWSPSDAIAINVLPDRCGDTAYHELWRKIASVLRSPALKIFQNFMYDTSYFSAYGIRTEGEIYDTMHAMKVLWPELDSNLGNVGRIYTKRIYWKDDGKVEHEEGKKKDWGNVRDWGKHYAYNCLAKGMKVVTEKGLLSIDKIVKNKMPIKVRCYNEKTKCMEWGNITRWLEKREKANVNWVKLNTEEDGNKNGLLLTTDHNVLCQSGWKQAVNIVPGDNMITEGVCHNIGTIAGTFLGDSSIQVSTNVNRAYLTTMQISPELIRLKQNLFGGTVTSSWRETEYGANTFYSLYVPACAQLKHLSRLSIVSLLQKLTPLGLALWIMDDGCKQKSKYPHMKLALQSYSQEERNLILSFFRSRYSAKASVDKAGNLSMSGAMSRKVCAELGCFFVPSMRYKMSHPGPEYSLADCMTYASKPGRKEIMVTGVSRERKKKRGYKTSYCITVNGNGNFLTEYGIVANCRDTAGTIESSRNQRTDLRERGLEDFYKSYTTKLVDCAREMCATGMPLDLDRRASLQVEIESRIKTLTTDFHAKVGAELNPNSPAQVKKWLLAAGVSLPKKYDKSADSYKETADSNAIKKIRIKKDLPGLSELQEIKTLGKALSSYINFEARSDGRLSYSLNITGTETLRWSGGKDPWGRGFNIQTIPKEGGDVSIKSMFLAPEGHSFIEVDLRQAESRFVAYDSADSQLIEMLESGADVHSHVGNAILRHMGRDPSAIDRDEFKRTWRQLGKKAGHGLNYGMKASVFADTVFNELDMVISRKDAEMITEAYYGLFPGIPRWHAWIRRELYMKRKLTTPTGWERYFYGRPGTDMFKEAAAFRPQHTIPFLTNHLMLHLCDLRSQGKLKFQLIDQVHDSLTLLTTDAGIEDIARVCLDTKAGHPAIDLPGGRMYIPRECKAGKRMSELKEII